MASTKTASARPAQHETLKLALAVIDMIPKVGRISTAQIHQRLVAQGYERTRRSVERQMEALGEQLPIECDRSSKPYGYRWKTNYPGMSVPGLTLNESLLLRLAEEHLKHLLPPDLMRAMQGFFDQARINLGPDQEVCARQERRWLRKVRVVSPTQPLLPPPIHPGVLETVTTSLYRETWLEVDYKSAGGKQNTYRVMPLGLAQQGTRLILVARFDGHANERSLALSRVLSVKDTGQPFAYPADFELRNYEEAGRFGFSQGEDVAIKFRLPKASGQFLKESRLSASQLDTELPDGRLEFSAIVKKTEQLIWWLRGFGNDLEFISPKNIKARL